VNLLDLTNGTPGKFAFTHYKTVIFANGPNEEIVFAGIQAKGIDKTIF